MTYTPACPCNLLGYARHILGGISLQSSTEGRIIKEPAVRNKRQPAANDVRKEDDNTGPTEQADH